MTAFQRLRAAAAVAAIAAAVALPAAAQSWRGWNIHPEGYSNTVAMEQFAAEVNEKTGGRLTLEVFNSGVLGSQPDAIEQTRMGALDFANFNLGPMGPIIPATNVVSLPFIFNDVEHMHRVMDGEVGQIFATAMEAEGLVPLSWFDSGSRSFYNSKRPITAPADVEGLKIRVMNNELFVDMVAQLGGNATPMAFAEVYQSLKTGVIDGAENNYPSYQSTNHYEVAGFYSITDHLIIPECLCVSTKAWGALSDADKEIVRAAAVNAANTQRELWKESEKAARAAVEAAGSKINEVADKSAFQERMTPVYAKFTAANPDLAPIIDAIKATP